MNKSQFNQYLNKIGIKTSNNSHTDNVRKHFESNINSSSKNSNNLKNYLSDNNNNNNNITANKTNITANNNITANKNKSVNNSINISKNSRLNNNIRKNSRLNDNITKNFEYDGNNSGNKGGKNYILSVFFTIFSIVLLFFVVKLGYYIYVSDCDKKPLVEYLFSMSLEPCGKTADIVRSILHEEEVFHISDQIYNYESAKCKCKSYGVRFATEQEIIEAYNQGANWCTYGWCEGGKAFYPVQTNYYQAIQNDPDKRNSCSKPGVNGGVFNPSMKFGINCYGIKPKGAHIQSDIDTSEKDIQDYCDVDDVKEIVKVNTSDKIVSFNNDKWSKFD